MKTAKTKSASDQTSSEEVKEIQRQLRHRFLPATDGVQLEKYLDRFLVPLVRDAQERAEIARELARHLIATVCFFPKSLAPLQELIENRPREFAALLEASSADTLRRIAPFIARLPRPKRRRAKVETEAERKQRIKSSKRRHDLRRRFERDGPGLIETQFGQENISRVAFTSVTQALFGDPTRTAQPRVGECLDTLFLGGEVEMTGPGSLQRLFGRHRKLLPKRLARRRVGPRFLYGYVAVCQCFEFLLKQNQWLSNPAMRRTVLRNVLEHASEIATPDTFLEIQRVLVPFLSSGNSKILEGPSPTSN